MYLRAWLSLCALLVLGCGDDSPGTTDPTPDTGLPVDMAPPALNAQIQITEPADGDILATRRFTVLGTFSGVAAGARIVVDGVMASSPANGEFEAELQLAPGAHTLTATVGDASHSVTITVDPIPPRIDITNPLRASHTEAEQLDLAFTITDDSALTSVTLDQRDVDSSLAPDFLLQGVPLQPGLNIMQIEATDQAGNSSMEHVSVLRGALGDPAAILPRAIRLRIGTAAIDALEAYAINLIDEQDIIALLPQTEFMAPPFNLKVASIGYQHPVIVELTPQAELLAARLRLNTVAIGLELTIGDRPPSILGFGASHIEVTGNIRVHVENGRIITEIEDTEVIFGDLEFEFGDVPDFLNDPEMGQSLLSETIGAAVLAFADRQLPALIDSVLESLDTSFELELLGSQLELTFIPEVIVISEAGIGARLDVQIQVLNPAPGEPTLSGFYTTPSRWEGLPATDQIAIAIDDDLFNLFLYQFWRAGTLFPTLDQAFFDANDGSIRLVTGVLGNLLAATYPELNREDPIRILTDLPLPPVVRLLKGSDKVLLELGVGDLSLDITTDDDILRKLLAGSASLRLQGEVGLSINEAGSLGLSLMTTDFESSFDVTTEALRGEVENSLEAPLNTLLRTAGALLPGLLNDIPLPSLSFFPIGDVSASVAEVDPNFLVITATIENQAGQP